MQITPTEGDWVEMAGSEDLAWCEGVGPFLMTFDGTFTARLPVP